MRGITSGSECRAGPLPRIEHTMVDSAPSGKRPNYGIDAPGVVQTMTLVGVSAIAAGGISWLLLRDSSPVVASMLFHFGIWPGLVFLAQAGVMLWGSKYGKLRLRDRVLDRIVWRGDETVLDVGCGHGLLLIGAARRLRSGKAIGIDLWQRSDQAGNSPEATWANARLEGVADRIDIKDGDARKLPFADGSFNVIVSSWAIHNIYDAPGRAQALREIVRVLKPGGQVVIVDIRHSAEYVEVLRVSGMTDVQRSGPNFLFVIPTRTVTARKPEPAG
jgi:SAM-dependent methyltransferase